MVLKKGVFILTKFHFYIKHSFEISGKGLLYFYQETSSLIGNQTNHRTNMSLPYWSNSRDESDYECICIVINGKTRSVPWPYLPVHRLVPQGTAGETDQFTDGIVEALRSMHWLFKHLNQTMSEALGQLYCYFYLYTYGKCSKIILSTNCPVIKT